jgi:hypothetical protein
LETRLTAGLDAAYQFNDYKPMNNRQILEIMLDSFKNAISSGDTEECALQFVIWMNHVESTFSAAGMTSELQVWRQAQENVEFDPDENSFSAQAESMKAILIAILSKSENTIIDINRINELREIQSSEFDLAKLIRLCEEINICWERQCFFAVAALSRAILDHIPPVFGFDKFSNVANNHSGERSFKESMQHLDQSSRKIANSHLHSQIKKREVLPNCVQVNFSNNLDVLLAEIIKILN